MADTGGERDDPRSTTAARDLALVVRAAVRRQILHFVQLFRPAMAEVTGLCGLATRFLAPSGSVGDRRSQRCRGVPGVVRKNAACRRRGNRAWHCGAARLALLEHSR